MPVAASSYLEVVERLPLGAALRVNDVSWEDYEQLLADLGPSYRVRIFYDQGRMEVMSPKPKHEKPTKIIHTLLIALRDELDVDVESFGSTTFKDKLKDIGAEPDDCFYVQHAAAMIGLENDPESLPPPDLVVESDLTSSSLNRFPIYAALGVPEIWRVVNWQVQIWRLGGETYEQAATSYAFPFLTAAALQEFLAKGRAEGERKTARAFREWVRGQVKSSS